MAQFKLNLGEDETGGEKKSTITFLQVFQNKNNNEGRIIFHFNPGAPA